MANTHRSANPEPLIVPTIMEQKGTEWSKPTREVAASDAQRVLESLIAEFGIDEAVRALDNQGLRGSAYRYLLSPLHEEAVARRIRAQTRRQAES